MLFYNHKFCITNHLLVVDLINLFCFSCSFTVFFSSFCILHVIITSKYFELLFVWLHKFAGLYTHHKAAYKPFSSKTDTDRIFYYTERERKYTQGEDGNRTRSRHSAQTVSVMGCEQTHWATRPPLRIIFQWNCLFGYINMQACVLITRRLISLCQIRDDTKEREKRGQQGVDY